MNTCANSGPSIGWLGIQAGPEAHIALWRTHQRLDFAGTDPFPARIRRSGREKSEEDSSLESREREYSRGALTPVSSMIV